MVLYGLLFGDPNKVINIGDGRFVEVVGQRGVTVVSLPAGDVSVPVAVCFVGGRFVMFGCTVEEWLEVVDLLVDLSVDRPEGWMSGHRALCVWASRVWRCGGVKVCVGIQSEVWRCVYVEVCRGACVYPE